MKHAIRYGVLFALLLAVVAGPAPASVAASGSDEIVQLTRIGHPAWKPVDFHLFSAPIGTADSGYAEFGATMLALLPPPNHVAHPNLGVGPGTPHLPPYDTEFAQGVANLSYHQGQRFRASEFSNGNGVWLTWMNVPQRGASIGSSPDFAAGPIIPNSLFPITVSAVTVRNGAPFNPNLFSGSVPALDGQLDPPFAVDGHSHFPMFIADNLDFGPSGTRPQGSYEYRITLTDQQGNGWSIVARFSIAR